MLHDDGPKFDRDTVVVDVPTAPRRSPTKEFDVQVMLDDGFFHREMDWKTTACGLAIPAPGQWHRINKYEGNLCPKCYTPVELARTKAANDAEHKHLTGENEPLPHVTGSLAQEEAAWLIAPPPVPRPPRRR